MKKTTLLSAAFLFSMFAAANSQAQMHVGLRAGANLSTLAMENADGSAFKTRVAPNVAVLFNYQISPSFSIQAEPGFSQRGAKIENTTTLKDNTQTYRYELKGKTILNYIEMPVLAQYRPSLGKLEGIVSLGPEVRVLAKPQVLKGGSKVYINGELAEENTAEEVLSGDDGPRKFDFGLVGGVGVAYPVGNLRIFAEARYHFGLLNLFKQTGSDDVKVYNRAASVSVGVLVPVGKR